MAEVCYQIYTSLAERTGHPVLCTGDDFAATDITVVRPRPTPDAAQVAPARSAGPYPGLAQLVYWAGVVA